MKAKSYTELKKELDEVLSQLENEETDIDKAVELHNRGQKLIVELESYLKKAQAKIKKLKP